VLKSRFVIIRKLFARECHAHIIVISKRAAPSLQHTHSHRHTHTQAPAGIRIFNIRRGNFSLLFFCAAHLAKTIIISPDSCLRLCAWKLASEKFAAERNYGDVGLHSWRGRGNKQRRKVSKAAYARTHIQHAQGLAEFCADVSPLSYWK
jgi:hypothetical protein